MRLAGPVYESLPFVYAVIGAFAIGVSYVDAQGARAAATFVVGLAAEIAALTLFLRRRGYREMRREYTGGDLAPPADERGAPAGAIDGPVAADSQGSGGR